MVKAVIEGEQVIIRPVKQRGNSGGVTVPIGWVGRSVYVVLMSEKEEANPNQFVPENSGNK